MKSLYKKYREHVQNDRPASGRSHSKLGYSRKRRQAKKATNTSMNKDFSSMVSDALFNRYSQGHDMDLHELKYEDWVEDIEY